MNELKWLLIMNLNSFNELHEAYFSEFNEKKLHHISRRWHDTWPAIKLSTYVKVKSDEHSFVNSSKYAFLI